MNNKYYSHEVLVRSLVFRARSFAIVIDLTLLITVYKCVLKSAL